MTGQVALASCESSGISSVRNNRPCQFRGRHEPEGQRARPIGKDHRGRVGSHLCSGVLVALFFFPGVCVGDGEVVEGEGAGCFRRGDQAVDGLGFSGEGVGGRAAPRRGQRDGACGVGIGAVEA